MEQQRPHGPHRALWRGGAYRAGGLQAELGQGLRRELKVGGQRGLLVPGAEGGLAVGGGGLRDDQRSRVSRVRQASHPLAIGDLPDNNTA